MNTINPTIKFLKNKFAEYYSTTELLYPERFTRREWGFMFIGESFMQRHIAFKKTTDLIKFLISNKSAKRNQVPSHVYYSSAYYEQPELQPMTAKVEGWLGADLIFDLDDDHLRNVEELTYQQRLAKVKDIVRNKLLDDFILGDFGFDSKNIKIAFSGSRGYHIHVRDPKVFLLTSAERREIVDYLTGIGLNMERIFPFEAFETKEYSGKKFSKKKLVTPRLDAPGWKGRMAKGTFNLITELSELPEEKALEKLLELTKTIKINGKKISEKDINTIYNELFISHQGRITKESFEKRNVLELFSKDSIRNKFLIIVKEHEKVEMAGETDEPVTTDVKRLIRMPTSLHGKTGFKVIPLDIDELADFEPLKDAIVFSSVPMKIKITTNEQLKFTLGGEDFTVEPGEVEIPEFAAIYLICQRKAEIV